MSISNSIYVCAKLSAYIVFFATFMPKIGCIRFHVENIFFFEDKKESLSKCFVSIVDSRCNVELLYNSGGKTIEY